MLFSLIALFIVMIVTDADFHVTLILLPVAFIYMLLFSLGVSLILSVSVIYFRDIKHLYGVFLSALNYLTPIFLSHIDFTRLGKIMDVLESIVRLY